jgi:hypothetical protein
MPLFRFLFIGISPRIPASPLPPISLKRSSDLTLELSRHRAGLEDENHLAHDGSKFQQTTGQILGLSPVAEYDDVAVSPRIAEKAVSASL